MPTFRIIRCANAQLYIGATLLVLGAAAYVLCCKDALWQQVAAIAAAIITPIWTAFYVCLKYTVDSTGITRSSLLGSTGLKWADLSSATLQESQNQGTASCTILLQAGETSLRISSDLLPLDEVQELARELREIGLLH